MGVGADVGMKKIEQFVIKIIQFRLGGAFK